MFAEARRRAPAVSPFVWFCFQSHKQGAARKGGASEGKGGRKRPSPHAAAPGVTMSSSWLPLEARKPIGLTLEEQFTRTFDVYPFQPATNASTMKTTDANGRPLGMTTGSIYGFGSASLRFQNEVYGSHLAYGKANKCVIELNPPEPVAVTELAENAPSRMLPEFAAFFSPELGRTFQRGINRDAPPGPDGSERFYVQPKDSSGVFPSPDPPDIFSMAAPRGTGRPNTMHEVPQCLMTPAERREALVFDKCHERARKELRKAANDACQITSVMQSRYPTGVIGLEGPNCPDSILYRIPHEKKKVVEAAKAKHAIGRHDNLAKHRETQLPYNFMHHEPTNTTKELLFPRKAKTTHSASDRELSHYEMRPLGHTTDGGFRSNQEKPLERGTSEVRSQMLLGASTGNKPFNIISGVEATVKPAGAPTSHFVDRRAHPSNLAMPRSTGHGNTLVGPIPEAHKSEWKPPSPNKSPSNAYMR